MRGSRVLSNPVTNYLLPESLVFTHARNLIPCFLTVCSTVLVDPFDPYSPFKFLIFYSSTCSLLALYRHYNNHSGAYIAGTQNSTGAYIVIMASLQTFVNSLPVWQSSCESKLCQGHIIWAGSILVRRVSVSVELV